MENQPLEKKIIAYLNLPSHQNLEIVKDELLAMLKSNCDNHNTLIGFFTVMSESVIDGRQCWEPDFVSKNGNDYEVFYTNINEVIKRDFCNDNFQLSVTEIKENFRIFKEVYLNAADNDGWVLNPYCDFPFFLEKIDLEDILDRAVSEHIPFLS